jgi:hypothetical protein
MHLAKAASDLVTGKKRWLSVFSFSVYLAEVRFYFNFC